VSTTNTSDSSLPGPGSSGTGPSTARSIGVISASDSNGATTGSAKFRRKADRSETANRRQASNTLSQASAESAARPSPTPSGAGPYCSAIRQVSHRSARPDPKPEKSGGTRLAGLTVTLIGTPHQRDRSQVRGRNGGRGMASAGHAAHLLSLCNFAERNAGTFKRMSK
jgi:hypothetical protein